MICVYVAMLQTSRKLLGQISQDIQNEHWAYMVELCGIRLIKVMDRWSRLRLSLNSIPPSKRQVNIDR